MFLSELIGPAARKHASFCFGRMNPPTKGHEQLINKVALSADGGDYYVFVSSTQDPTNNPLDAGTKIKFLKSLCPLHAQHIINAPEIIKIFHAATMLYDAGYRHVTFVAGSDRLEYFKKLLEQYNGVSGKPHGYYQFESFNYVSSGDRDPDADGLAGISASGARAAAAAGDIDQFAQATGAGQLTKELYAAVRAGMQIKDVKEDAAGVGVIANKKQARDPRYMMSLTRDVRPGETERQLRKMHLK